MPRGIPEPRDYRLTHAESDRAEHLLRGVLDETFTEHRRELDTRALNRELARDADRAIQVMRLDELFDELRPRVVSTFQRLLARGSTVADLPEVAKREPPVSSALVFDAELPEAADWARREGGRLVDGIDRSQRAGVRDVVSRAITEGGHPFQTAEQLRGTVGLDRRRMNALAKRLATINASGITSARANELATGELNRALTSRLRAIARTETLRAVNEGQRLAWGRAQDAGLLRRDFVREWIVTYDERTCPICRPLSGTTAPIRGPFAQAGVFSPPVHPLCRCTTSLTRRRRPRRLPPNLRRAAQRIGFPAVRLEGNLLRASLEFVSRRWLDEVANRVGTSEAQSLARVADAWIAGGSQGLRRATINVGREEVKRQLARARRGLVNRVAEENVDTVNLAWRLTNAGIDGGREGLTLQALRELPRSRIDDLVRRAEEAEIDAVIQARAFVTRRRVGPRLTRAFKQGRLEDELRKVGVDLATDTINGVLRRFDVADEARPALGLVSSARLAAGLPEFLRVRGRETVAAMVGRVERRLVTDGLVSEDSARVLFGTLRASIEDGLDGANLFLTDTVREQLGDVLTPQLEEALRLRDKGVIMERWKQLQLGAESEFADAIDDLIASFVVEGREGAKRTLRSLAPLVQQRFLDEALTELGNSIPGVRRWTNAVRRGLSEGREGVVNELRTELQALAASTADDVRALQRIVDPEDTDPDAALALSERLLRAFADQRVPETLLFDSETQRLAYRAAVETRLARRLSDAASDVRPSAWRIDADEVTEAVAAQFRRRERQFRAGARRAGCRS